MLKKLVTTITFILLISCFGCGVSTDDCKSDVRAYEFGREMATWSSMRGGIGLSKSIEEYNSGVFNSGFEANGCVKRGFKDAQSGTKSPYNKSGKSWTRFK